MDLHLSYLANLAVLFLICGGYFASSMENSLKGGVVPRQESDEKRLFRDLMRDYEKAVRPVNDSDNPVRIKLGITLTQIFDFDEKNQVLTVNVWLDQEWYDDNLHWDPAQYGGLKVIRLPCDYLWLPDIVLYNSVDDYTTPYMRALAMVQNDGQVFWPPIVRFRCSCKVDITYFPFDDQVCHMKMGSWAYDGFQVDVLNRTSEIDLSNYIDNGEWELIKIVPIRNVVEYGCCPEPFPDVTFWMHLRRRTTYYTFNVIIPCVILSFLTMSSFLLPAVSGEKVSLGLTVLLAFSVFMLLIAETMPATSEFVPLIGLYLTVIMAMTSMSVVLSVFVLHVHHRGSRGLRAPRWLRVFSFSFVARILCIRVATPEYQWQEMDNMDNKSDMYTRLKGGAVKRCQQIHQSNHGSFKNSNGMNGECGTRHETSYVPRGHANNNCSQTHQYFQIQHNGPSHQNLFQTPESTANQSNDYTNSSGQVQQELLEHIRCLVKRQEANEHSENICREWQEISAVCDRLLFIVFMVITTCSTVGLLIIQPMTKSIDLEEHIRNKYGYP